MRLFQTILAVLVVLGLATDRVEARSLKSCVAGIRKSAIRSGIPANIVNRALGNVRFNEKVVRFSRNQPEFRTPIWDYMAFLVDARRVRDGKAMMKKYARTLKAVEKRYGVDRYILTALWGVESDYGNIHGEFFLPHALANVACAGRKPKMFKRELISALKLVKRGDVRLKDLMSSWAGALGQTQFMPSTYHRLAVDFDGNGRRDLLHSVPDALASSANFLRKSGWRKGGIWGYEVRLPKAYRGPFGRKRTVSLDKWAKRGIRKINGKKPSGNIRAGLIAPAGRTGPAFLVFHNFNVLYSYNAAVSYTLAISHLSDRLRGRGGFARGWPTSDPGLSRKQRVDLQVLLKNKGYRIGKVDGRIGPLSKAAIRKVQKNIGMRATGRPSLKVYRSLGGKL